MDRSRKGVRRSKTGSGSGNRSTLLNAVALQDHFSRSLKLDVQIRKMNRTRNNMRQQLTHGEKFSQSLSAREGCESSNNQSESEEWRTGWTCERCTLLNNETSKRCSACKCSRKAQLQQLRKQDQRTLAQRRGLVPGPPPKLTESQWKEAIAASAERKDSFSPCPICCQTFALKDQLILSCSHVFHKKCIESFESFTRASDRKCPLCRKTNYEKRKCNEGKKAFRKMSIIKLQSWFRGLKIRRLYNVKLRNYYASGNGDEGRRRMFFAKRLDNVTSKLIKSIEAQDDSLDRLFEEFDQSVYKSRQILNGSENRVETPDKWEEIRRKAFQRGCLECPICMSEINVCSNEKTKAVLLACSHVFHASCITAFEKFQSDKINFCPMCRANYEGQKTDLFTTDSKIKHV